jgi:hypothetical protein
VTPAEHLIQSRNDEIVSKWNRARFRRLAMILNMTEGELNRMAYGSPFYLRRWLKDNKFPAAVAGHLENIERWVLQSRLKARFDFPTAQDEILQQKVKELAT